MRKIKKQNNNLIKKGNKLSPLNHDVSIENKREKIKYHQD